jgi:hypothetical protein
MGDGFACHQTASLSSRRVRRATTSCTIAISARQRGDW